MDLNFNLWPTSPKIPTLKGSKYIWVPKYFYFLLGGFELKLRFHSFLRIDSFRGVHLQQMTEREHIGLFGQIWDKRLRQKYKCLYHFCLWMFQKTNGPWNTLRGKDWVKNGTNDLYWTYNEGLWWNWTPKNFEISKCLITQIQSHIQCKSWRRMKNAIQLL